MSIVHCNLPNEKLSEKEFDEIEQRMYPGKYSGVGFLQEGERLRDVINADDLYLKSVGITYEQIADRLETIVGKYSRTIELEHKDDAVIGDVSKIMLLFGKEKKRTVENRYLISDVSYMGAQECPFQNKKLDNRYHGYAYGSRDLTVYDTVTEREIVFNTLLPHMIRCHKFFESPKSSHRLEPRDVIEILEIKPDVCYKPMYKYYHQWSSEFSSSEYPKESELGVLKQLALKKYDIDNDTFGLLFPSRNNIYNMFGDNGEIIKIYENGINNNLTWEKMRIEVFELENDKKKNKRTLDGKQYHESRDEICSKIKEEIDKIDGYKKTGNINGLYLYLFSKNYEKTKLVIENMECDNWSRFAVYSVREYRYLPISDVD